jgi:hypothetical protein
MYLTKLLYKNKEEERMEQFMKQSSYITTNKNIFDK